MDVKCIDIDTISVVTSCIVVAGTRMFNSIHEIIIFDVKGSSTCQSESTE